MSLQEHKYSNGSNRLPYGTVTPQIISWFQTKIQCKRLMILIMNMSTVPGNSSEY